MFENIEYTDIVERIKTDIATALPESNPRIFGSFIRALAVANAGRHYDNTLLLEQAAKEIFPQTSTGTFLKYWLQFEGLQPLEQAESSGNITVTGEVDTVIPANTQFKTDNDIFVQSLNLHTCTLQTFDILSLVRSGNTVTGTTVTDHSFASGLTVTISGADQTEYNGNFIVTVLDNITFTYTILELPVSPATGTITSSYNGVSVFVEALEFGTNGNLEGGTSLRNVPFIEGLGEFSFVQYLGLTGGLDAETPESIRQRILQSRANPVANFNIAAIEKQAFSVLNVTRTFIKPITPYVGAVTIAFMQDVLSYSIPTSIEITKVKDKILEILPASSDANDIFVLAPTPIYVDFVFTDLFPNSSSLQAEIIKNIEKFFTDNNYVTYEKDIDRDAYRSAIFDTIDPETGLTVQTFTLSEPSTEIYLDIPIGENEIGLLGNITFAV